MTVKEKTILFIVPNLKTGGTMSSLSAIYKEFHKELDFRIFTLTKSRNSNFPFDDKIITPGDFFSLYHAKMSDVHGLMTVYAFFVKSTKKICSLLHINLMSILYSRYAKRLEEKLDIFKVVAFEEAMTTYFGSFFHRTKIAWIHCNYDFYRPFYKDEYIFYAQFEKIICVSKYTSDVFIKHYPQLKSKVDYIYNLMDEDRILSLSTEPINDENFDFSEITLISAGRLDPIKRFSQIPEIASLIRQKIKDFKWYILGPVAIEEEKDKLVENIKKYKVQDIVFWLGNKNNPYNYFRKSDLYVCTSLSEACPMVFNEAFLLGLPVVTTEFGSVNEFISQGINGIISPISSMSESLIHLLSDVKKIDEYKKNIKNSVNFNQKIIGKLDDLLSN